MFGLGSLGSFAGSGVSPLGGLGALAGNGFSSILGAFGFGGGGLPQQGFGGFPQQGFGGGFPQQGFGVGYGVGAPNLPNQQANRINAGVLAAGATGIAGGLAGFAGIQGQQQGGSGIAGGLTLPQQGFPGAIPQANAPGGIIPLILAPITNIYTVLKSIIFLKRTINETRPPDLSSVKTSYDQYSDYMYDLRSGGFDLQDAPSFERFGVDAQKSDDASKGYF